MNLAVRTNVSEGTIFAFEKGEGETPKNNLGYVRAFEAALEASDFSASGHRPCCRRYRPVATSTGCFVGKDSRAGFPPVSRQ